MIQELIDLNFSNCVACWESEKWVAELKTVVNR